MRRRSWSAAAAVVAALLAVPLPGTAARAEPAAPALPELPNPSSGCVPASPSVQRGVGWAQARMAAPAVWPLTRGGGVTVAVLDTGVSPAAPALTGAVQAGVDVAGTGAGVEKGRPGRADSDCRGRGTFLAGLVAGRPVDGTDFAGVAPAATILPVRVTDARGKLTADTLAAGLRAAVTGGARVVLIAAAVATPTVALRDAVEFAVANNVVVVAAVAGAEYGRHRTSRARIPGGVPAGARRRRCHRGRRPGGDLRAAGGGPGGAG